MTRTKLAAELGHGDRVLVDGRTLTVDWVSDMWRHYGGTEVVTAHGTVEIDGRTMIADVTAPIDHRFETE